MNVNPARTGGAGAAGEQPDGRREPFAATLEDDFYYSETQRAKSLHFLLHLAPYSDVLLLTGARGSGKSSLIHQFVSRASPSWRICVVDACGTDQPRQLLEAMAEVFLFDVSPDLEATLASLRKMLQALRKSALVPVLIIDEAHRLSLPLLELLGRLVETATPEERQLCIILVGEPVLEERLRDEALGGLRARVGHSFELPPFDEEETAKYIQHRLRVAGVSRESALLAPSTVQRIYQQSGGLPGRINECAREALQAEEKGGRRQDGAGGPGPARRASGFHRRPGHNGQDTAHAMGRKVLLVLAAVVLGAVLWFQEEINRWLAGEGGTAPAALQSPSRQLPPPPPLPEPKPKPEPLPEPRREPQPESQAASQAASQAGADRATASKVPAPEASAGAEQAVRPVARPGGRAETAAAVETQAGEVPASRALSAQVASESVSTKRQSQPQAGTELLGQDWLRSRDPSRYTLQLLAMNRSRVLALARAWQLDTAPDAATYYTRPGTRGVPLLALAHGDYPSREAALAAIPEIKRRFTGIEPWARSFASIHALLDAQTDSQTNSQSDIRSVTGSEATSEATSESGPTVAPDALADREDAASSVAGTPTAASAAMTASSALDADAAGARAGPMGGAMENPSEDMAEGLAERLRRDEQHILGQAPDRYVVQLMAMEPGVVTRLVRKWGIESEVRYFRTLRGDRELVAVIYGDYARRDEALSAGRTLAQRFSGVEPWVRPVQAVHDAIRAFRAIRR